MRFSTTAVLLASTGLVAAQSATSSAATSVASCAAQNIVDACLATTKSALSLCGPNDYACLCSKWIDINTCYANCPNDPDSFGASQNKVSYCNAANAYSTTNSIYITAAATSSKPSTLSTATATESGNIRVSGSSTAAGSSATHTGAASTLALSAGGMLAAVAGLMSAFL